jgi:MraZ protein
MDMLTGEYRNTLDEKGRILFPAKLRSELTGNVLVVTQSLDRCLWLFTPEEWKAVSSKLMDSASPFNEKNRLVLRRFIAPAQEIEFDRSGRLSIPQSLREYASLSKDCVLLGVNKYIELWDAESYKTYLEQSEASFRDAAEELGTIVF